MAAMVAVPAFQPAAIWIIRLRVRSWGSSGMAETRVIVRGYRASAQFESAEPGGVEAVGLEVVV